MKVCTLIIVQNKNDRPIKVVEVLVKMCNTEHSLLFGKALFRAHLDHKYKVTVRIRCAETLTGSSFFATSIILDVYILHTVVLLF